jgi:hypothetical protein
MSQYQQFVINKIGGFPHVAHIQSVFAMDTLKQVQGFPLS